MIAFFKQVNGMCRGFCVAAVCCWSVVSCSDGGRVEGIGSVVSSDSNSGIKTSESDSNASVEAGPRNSNEPLVTAGLAPVGAVATASPRFSWSAVSGVGQYQLVVEDGAGNQYRQDVEADAHCDASTDICSAHSSTRYYNQQLNWRVNAVREGQATPITKATSFKTPVNTVVLPVTDNAAVCDVWPALFYDRYAVLNNIWNAGSMRSNTWRQTIAVEQTIENKVVASWAYDWLAPSQGGLYDVKAYPEVIYGNKLGTLITGDKLATGLPERIDSLPEFVVDFRYSETGKAERNVAVESFFHSSCNITGPCHIEDNRAYEMMVWINNPVTRRPGDLALEAVRIDGRLWNVYIKPRSNKKYIAFTAQTPITDGALNWNRFVEWTVDWTTKNAISQGIDPMTPDQCMGAIEFGTELWSGSGTFTLDHFAVSRN